MAERNLTISSILGGQQPTETLGGDDQFIHSTSIDPDESILFPDGKRAAACGFINPKAYEDRPFVTTPLVDIDARVIAIITEPETDADLVYVILKNGKILAYTAGNNFLSEDESKGQVAGSNAEGAVYYNDFIYIFGTGASKNDVSRYGPLSGEDQNNDSITDGVWTGSTLGSQTALADHAMPGNFLKHWGHVHTDNQLYFADFVDGQGVIHSIKTDETGTNDGTAYNVLDLPFGYRVTDIESFGTDLIISAVQTTGSRLNEGRAALFLWDTTNDVTFYRQVEVPAPFVSALLNKNGLIYLWYGFGVDEQDGAMVGTYNGGYSITMIDFKAKGQLPPPAAVAFYGNRVAYANGDEVYALGYKNSKIGSSSARHSIARVTGTGFVSAIAYPFQQDGGDPKLVVGKEDTLSEENTTDSNLTSNPAVMYSKMINVGQQFTISKIAIPLNAPIDANTNITVKIHYDNDNETVTLPTVNNTNFTDGERRIVFKERSITDADGSPSQKFYNFFIEMEIGSDEGVALPILITVDTIDD